MLDSQTFIQIVASTPLVSIDLVLVRNASEVLLGLRNNRPAKDFWFVPGGRILKNESRYAALIRIVDKELGLGRLIESGDLKPTFQGTHEHMYDDSFAGEVGVSTHYVVLAYKIDVSADFALPVTDEQHSEFKWWLVDDAAKSDIVHQYSKDYF